MAFLVISIIIIVVFSSIVHFLFKERITLQESLVKCSVATVLGMVFLGIIYFRDMSDTAIINGQVTGKERVKVSCSHSYSCNCREVCSGSGNNQSCSTICDTCYDHSYDVDWRVYTTVGTKEIDRVNRQGTEEPPRWTKVIIGEPAASEDSYTNYVKAAPDSLFSMNGREQLMHRFEKLIPKYPKIYDYYRVNRVIQVGTVYKQSKELNDFLNDELRTLGKEKQVNIIIIFVNTPDADYRYALERAWLGSKKNDVVVLLGMDGQTLSWVDTITFGKNAGNALLAVQMRDRIKALANNQQFGSATMLSAIVTGTIRESFTRKQMKDFEYLKSDYSPSRTALMWYIIFQFLLLTGATIFFYHFELERGDWAKNNPKHWMNRIPNYRFTRRN